MENWEIALNKFLIPWKKRKDVVGALVCGSFVTGNPSKHSDIDVHIILKNGTLWRERGNKIINGFLIEYFANTPKSIKTYWSSDFNEGTQTGFTQFATGKILFDKGAVAKLKHESLSWMKKRFKKLSPSRVELLKYGLLDALDNTEDSLGRSDFNHIFYHTLQKTIETYCKFLRYPIVKETKVVALLTDEATRKKYCLQKFPDAAFTRLVIHAMTRTTPQYQLAALKNLVYYTLNKMGDFKINGWKVRTKI